MGSRRTTSPRRGYGGGRKPAHASAAAPHVGDVFGQLADRYPDRVPLAAGGSAQAAVLPRITPLTDLGRAAVRAYAARSGQSEEEYLQQMGEPLSPEAAGAAVVELVRAGAATTRPGYLLTAAGLQQLS
jgi:hypothetical protein